MNNNKEKNITKFINLVCKGQSTEEKKQAEANFLRYIQLVERIHNRIEREKQQKSSSKEHCEV